MPFAADPGMGVKLARVLAEVPEPSYENQPLVHLAPLDDELRALGVSEELANMFRRLLVLDRHSRPSAAHALGSPEYRALARLAAQGASDTSTATA